ncbi:4Fe-4S dicluster domain-containing protein [Aquitalea sp. LB_tupeE]|uniref:4Fe-4S dicluster domain-containing protein n=1 Tax=Aquitalea sp. LB_tupeE TaxID=2748078 RepID=UPI0015BAF5F4|nr:4Fe-4S dicluster domain-containing protein [Aquitalea sp. LB_tupeE]NWK76669.1 hypothetical protein [Aquitalea sp. LB_tupeE]
MRRFLSLPGGFTLPLPSRKHDSPPASVLPLPPRLVLGLQQCLPCVQPGQQVLKYQRLADADSEYGVALHAPTSGRIIAIQPQAQALPGAPLADTLILEADGRDEALPLQAGDPSRLTPLSLALQLQDMGVAGNHGPLLALDWAMQQCALPLLIINAVEDEPYLAATATLLEEQAEAFVAAIAMLEQVLRPARIVLAVSQTDSSEALQAAVSQHGWQVSTINTPYPAGDETTLIRQLASPAEAAHSLCLPADAVVAAGAAILHGQPCISRLVTLVDKLDRPGSVQALLGTPLSHLLNFAGAKANYAITHGGGLRGYALPADQADAMGLHWHSQCLQARTPDTAGQQQDCIRCGDCLRICPSKLQPQELYWHCQQDNVETANAWGLQDCTLCGLCDAVCPSQLPLLDSFRHTALQYQSTQQQQQQADHARQRHRFRQFRLERDKQEKAQRLAARAAEQAAKREQTATAAPQENKPTPAAADKQAAIAAAMARAAQRNSQHLEKQSTSSADDRQADARAAAMAASRQAAIDAAMARAAARKAAQDAAKAASAGSQQVDTTAASDDKQALIQSAMQRAAMQKAAQANAAPANMDADKKALIEAAMQRAAAQKTAQANAAPTSMDADKKALIEAAMQRAAAQKAAQADKAHAPGKPEKPENT